MENERVSVKKYIIKHGFTFGIIGMMLFSFFTFYLGFYVRHHLFNVSIILLIFVFAFMLRLMKFKRHILKYGVIFGIATIIYNLSFYFLDYSDNKFTITRLFILLFIITGSTLLGLLTFKKNNNNCISLKEALKISIGISLIGGLIAILWKILLIHVIDSGIIDQYKENNFKRLAESSLEFTQKDIDRRMAITKTYSSPLIMIYRRLVENLGNGIIFGLIIGLFVRKKKDPLT
ncbi:DUF4199 domain-containing protein [uncultured Aquimarina sp.]|uniref:DUF4199 domain-containing protein n=1 Tax=uncultured Aquimarina sp. TaxID=575652 RepID=UPI002631C573|nr:DUF4199 domain-containing protein [uncultured Aquimarina sp.]